MLRFVTYKEFVDDIIYEVNGIALVWEVPRVERMSLIAVIRDYYVSRTSVYASIMFTEHWQDRLYHEHGVERAMTQIATFKPTHGGKQWKLEWRESQYLGSISRTLAQTTDDRCAGPFPGVITPS